MADTKHHHAAALPVETDGIHYSGIVWSTLFGWMIWNEWPLPAVLAGAAVVIASNLLIIWRESRLGKLPIAE